MARARFLRSAIAAFVIAAASAAAMAGERVVPAEPGALLRAVAEAAPGDVLSSNRAVTTAPWCSTGP